MFTNFLVIFNCFIQILFSAMVLRIFIQNISFQSHKRRVEEVINKWQLRTMSTIVNNSFFSLFFRSFKLWKVLNKEKKVHIPGFSKETQQQNALNTGEFFLFYRKKEDQMQVVVDITHSLTQIAKFPLRYTDINRCIQTTCLFYRRCIL